MPVLIRASLGYLLRHPWQLGLAILGISIGVAVMVAVDLANESARKAFLMSMDALNGQATHQVVAGPGGVDERIYTSLRVNHGFMSAAPIVAGYIRAGDRALMLLGVDVFAEREFRGFTSPASITSDLAGNPAGQATSPETIIRNFLVGEGNALMSATTAAAIGIEAGEHFEVLANGKRFTATLAAVFTSAGQRQPEDVIVVDIAVAQHWLAMQGKLSRIDIHLESDESEMVEKIRNVLPPGTELLSAAGRTQTTADMSDAFMTNLSAMSLLALLVGVFLIYNSVAFAVLQRRDLIGILRALGVTRSQTFRLILTEAAALGVIGALLGALVGIWLGDKLLVLVARTVSDHYFAVNVTDVQLDSASILKGLIAGIGATLAAAGVPALEAAAYHPRLALTRSSLEQKAGSLVPTLGISGVALILLAALILAVSGRSLVAGLIALFLLIVGFAFCIPFFVRILSGALTPLAGRIAGTPGRLAIGGVGRTLSRTGVAIVALAIAVSATIGVSVMVGSFRLSVADWLTNTLQSDVYVGVPRGALDPDLLADLVEVPGIAHYSTSRRAWLETRHGRTRILALEMAPGSYAGTSVRHHNPDEVWRRFERESAVLVSDSYAYQNSVQAGDSVLLNTAAGQVELTIVAVYQSYDSNNGAVMMSRATYDQYFDDPQIDSIGIYLEVDASPESVIEKLREISAGKQALIMNSNARIREISLGIFDRTFVITNVLYWLAVGVAIIGILGAMLALQMERAKEFGVLRALGMTPAQTGGLVTMQTGFIGFLAGLAAIPLGLVMAWVLVEVINRRAFGWQIDMAVSPGALAWAMVLAVGAAFLAGIYPSWRAAIARPALAMRDE